MLKLPTWKRYDGWNNNDEPTTETNEVIVLGSIETSTWHPSGSEKGGRKYVCTVFIIIFWFYGNLSMKYGG